MPLGELPAFDPAFLSRLEQLHLSARRIFSGRQNAQHVSRKLGTGTEFADHRPYAAGDDLRLLDWNVYARTGRLYTKLFRQEEDRNLFFLVDVSGSMGVEQAKFDCARRLAACLAYIGLHEMDRVYLAGFSSGITVARPVLRGRRAVVEMLRFLSGLRTGGATDLGRTLHHFTGLHGGKDGLLFLVSDFLDLERVAAALDGFFRLGLEVVGLHVVTPAELEPRLLGEWRLEDPEGGPPRRVHLTRRMVARYKTALQQHGERVRRHLQARRGAYVRVRSDLPLEDLVLRELRAGHLLA
ncbi:MAG TPA: DUF58 domain-containing protein [Myxococcota bacterium]|nr:DUF58 domain-containing protein [Myxococcota bacterium]HRY91975.1 DUF58 domain-containing protein [Myxococcota bacterium]HSA21379.1 DUF58 domain-containing protein [Myxococcota bacterium]